MSDLLTVEQAREMGFDEEALADLRAQGAIRADDTFARVETLADVERLALKSLDYDAEEARLTTQYKRRLKAIADRRKWIALQADDCAAVLAEALPKKADGSYRKKSHDFDEVRVKLRQTGGGLVVDEAAFLQHMAEAPCYTPEEAAEAKLLLDSVRVSRVDTIEGVIAVMKIGHDGWKASVLKTPLAAYLTAHPDATLPGVSVAPIAQVFEIERPKTAEKDGVL